VSYNLTQHKGSLKAKLTNHKLGFKQENCMITGVSTQEQSSSWNSHSLTSLTEHCCQHKGPMNTLV